MKLAASFDQGLHRRLVDGLYVEAMVMADEERAYFDLRDAEKACQMLLAADKPMPLPAYDQCMKASHSFNLLDASGVISVRSEEQPSERQSLLRIPYAVI